MNAGDLFEALATLPGARSIPARGDGIAESRMLAGIEVARVSSADERAIRRAWRDRHGGGHVPLLVVAEDPGEASCVRALGPQSAGGPVRVVGADDLLRTFERLATVSPLHAVRELAEELDRLDRSGISGLQVKGLGTEHLFKTRLRVQDRWRRLGELAEKATGEWRPLLEALGYRLERLPRGYLLQSDSRQVAIVFPVADPSGFAKLDAEGRPPEGVLIGDCVSRGVPYGLLVSGTRVRLFEAAPESGSAVARYLELDAGALSEDDRPLLGLLAPEYLADGGFAGIMREARDFGVDLRRRIDRAIRQEVLPALGLELGRWARSEELNVADDRQRAELEAAALTFVFRALFLLYAESAGHLPMAQEAYRPHSFTQIVREAFEHREKLGPRSTTLWGRIQLLVRTLREGDPAWLVPPYNGALFAADGFEGAEVLERAAIPDAALGPALVALGIDRESEAGYDFSGLEIGHLGQIYEGLLSLRLSVADRPYSYDLRRDRYVPAEEEAAEVDQGDLLWLTDEGGRKGGGVYYTPEALVRHLVRRGVVPAFEAHLERVAASVGDDPEAAASLLFEFRVLDPACGSAHFLVAVVDEIADLVARFLGGTPLPAVRRQLDDLRAGAGATYGIGIEDVALLRRLVLKRCVYGVDLSPMGAEIAKISLWLASFVPGLSLAYLDHNVKVGNSLIGVAGAEAGEDFAGDAIARAIREGAPIAERLQAIADRTPDEVEESERVERELHEQMEAVRETLDLWVAESLGVSGARDLAWGTAHGDARETRRRAREVADEHHVFHWPLEFPEVFAERAGFDAVVGNPPWEEITVEELAFYARYQPGLRALPERERNEALAELKVKRPELAERLADELAGAAAMRRYFASDAGYVSGAGDPDLYKFFCQRYRALVAEHGRLAVVLPRSAFAAKGSTDFRRWLFESTTVRRLDFLLNSGRWAFDAEPRYTVSLLVAEAARPRADHAFEVAGVASSAAAFARQTDSPGISLRLPALGPLLEVPLLPSSEAAALLAKLRERGTPFPYGCGRWRCFPVAEFHETNDRRLWEGASDGWELWKGESFDQYDPHGSQARRCPPSEAALAKARKPRPGGESLLAKDVEVAERAVVVVRELCGARVAFRDVTNRTNSRTILAALVPPRTFLLNSAPYLTFVEDRDADRAACLGLMNSLVFDWQARRFVETHVNFFILEGLRLPSLSDAAYERIAHAAARLSCVDERFTDFATATGVECGPLDSDERERLRIEIDALVAHTWGLNDDDLEVIFADFTLDAVPDGYRRRLRARLAELVRE